MTGHATSCPRATFGLKGSGARGRICYQVLMEEPSLHRSRIALAGGLAAAILVGGAGFLIGRGTTERAPVVVAPAPVTPLATVTPEPPPERGVLGRPELIALAAAAADAAAAGRDPAAAIGEAEGRRFELRLPFGCNGPAGEASTAAMRWRYDAEDNALRLHVAPAVWAADDWWASSAPSGIEAIEGFWIMRPWTSGEACPPGGDRPAAVGVDPVTLPGQTLAIGQIFSAEGARGGRRDGKAYEAVVRVPKDELDTSGGFRLRVSGRIARIANAGAVRCQQPAGPEQRPICLVGVVMDEVAIENPANGETLATWTVAQRDASEG